MAAWDSCDLRSTHQIVFITGFATPVDTWSGLRILYHLVRRQYGSWSCPVYLRAWNDDMEQLAHIIALERKPKARLVVIAHSYGCGRGVVQLAPALARFGIDIDILCAIDPVIRPVSALPADVSAGILLAPLALLALTPVGRFPVPANVRQVATWRTLNHRRFDPVGRPLKLAPKTECIREVIFGDIEHCYEHHDQGEPGEYHVHTGVYHEDIDGNRLVHADILELIGSHHHFKENAT